MSTPGQCKQPFVTALENRDPGARVPAGGGAQYRRAGRPGSTKDSPWTILSAGIMSNSPGRSQGSVASLRLASELVVVCANQHDCEQARLIEGIAPRVTRPVLDNCVAWAQLGAGAVVELQDNSA